MEPQAGAEHPAPLARASRALATVEDAALVVLLALLVLLAFGQIVLRQAHIGIAWGDPMTRLLVLWVGVLGAIAATRANEHIAIDAVSRFLPLRLRFGVGAAMSLFASGVCGVFAFHAFRFVLFERAADTRFDLMPGWLAVLALPIGFALMVLRFALLAVDQLSRFAAQKVP